MIDNQQQVKTLMQQMKAALPIRATMTSQLARAFRNKGKVFHNRDIFIRSLIYSGDMGGISCDITPSGDAKEVYVVSLTQLRISRKHPLGEAIRAYQQVRKAKLAQQRW